MITIAQCIEFMESGKPFSCKVVSYDLKRKSGGKILEYDEAILVQNTKEEEEEAGRPRTNRETQVQRLTEMKRNPSHRKWYTRNIQLLQDGFPTSLIKKIHPPLIIEFNGDKEVAV